MPYVDFITDEHFLTCVKNLHNAYVKANKDIDKTKLYDNKLDIFKLSFDKSFGNLTEEELIKNEIQRQVDKSITNAIGTFHEEILGGITGYCRGILSVYDIKANDDSLFAEIKNKHNTVNSSSSETLYQKLQRFANENEQAKCYWVQILSTKSFCTQWQASYEKGKRKYNHERVYVISGDKFYELLSKKQGALFNLYKALPLVITDYLKSINAVEKNLANTSTAFIDIQKTATKHKRSLLDQIAIDNFNYYQKFNNL